MERGISARMDKLRVWMSKDSDGNLELPQTDKAKIQRVMGSEYL